MAVRRYALVGADLVVRNVVLAAEDWLPPLGVSAVLAPAAGVGDLYDPVQGVFHPPPERLEMLRAQVRDEVQARRDALMARGAPYQGKRIEVDDASRTNLGAVVTAALLAQMGSIAWPESVQSWITADNSLLPMPAPTDAIALGLSVLGWHSSLIQFARVLKDAVLAAEDPRAVAVAADWSPWEGEAAPEGSPVG